jgi:hypothetical protein
MREHYLHTAPCTVGPKPLGEAARHSHPIVVDTFLLLSPPQSTYRGRVRNRGSVSALSAGAYTTTLYVMVNIVKGDGVHPQPSPDWANFSSMMDCTLESGVCHSVCALCSPPCTSSRGTYSMTSVFRKVLDDLCV